MRLIVVPFRHRASQVAPLRETRMIDDTMTHEITAADTERPFLNSPKTSVNIRPAAYDRPDCRHAHAPPE